MEQKIVITDSDSTINEWINRGWTVVSVTAGYASTSAGGQLYNTSSIHGKFCFLIQKLT